MKTSTTSLQYKLKLLQRTLAICINKLDRNGIKVKQIVFNEPPDIYVTHQRVSFEQIRLFEDIRLSVWRFYRKLLEMGLQIFRLIRINNKICVSCSIPYEDDFFIKTAQWASKKVVISDTITFLLSI